MIRASKMSMILAISILASSHVAAMIESESVETAAISPVEILNHLLTITQKMKNACLSAASTEAEKYDMQSTDAQEIQNILAAGRETLHAFIPTFKQALAPLNPTLPVLQQDINEKLGETRIKDFGNRKFTTVSEVLNATKEFCNNNYKMLEDIKKQLEAVEDEI